jgi:hypothetical protein
MTVMTEAGRAVVVELVLRGQHQLHIHGDTTVGGAP